MHQFPVKVEDSDQLFSPELKDQQCDYIQEMGLRGLTGSHI